MLSRYRVHIGRGIWLAKDTYLLATHNVKFSTRRKFVRNILISLFGHDVLAASTITGKTSNRSKNEKKPEALDPTKLLAVKDIYRYFLKKEFKMSPENAELEADKTNQCVAKKIAQLKEIYERPRKVGRKLLGRNNNPDLEETLETDDYLQTESECRLETENGLELQREIESDEALESHNNSQQKGDDQVESQYEDY